MANSVNMRNEALDGCVLDRVRLHSGDPGAAGTSNALGAGLSNATFSAASSGERLLASDVTVTGLSANQSVTHFSVWKSTGSVFQGGYPIVSGDVQANAAGEYKLKAGTKVTCT